MTDLSSQWLGLPLASPILPGAAPFADDLDSVKRLRDAGAPAIVMHSLFEEQITRDQMAALRHMDAHGDSSAEALSYFPESDVFALGPDRYLEQIRRIREAVDVPVIASLNGVTPGGWTGYAKDMEQAGASALELNLYFLPSDPAQDAAQVEAGALETVQAVRDCVTIPVAVKLSPFWSALPNLAARLEQAGASGLVLFNRFYQPDYEMEELQTARSLKLSDSSELLLRLHWLGILSARLDLPLAAGGGVHKPLDAVKAIAAGACCVQVVSALLRHGPQQLRELTDGLRQWMQEHEYSSLEQLKGCMNLARCPDPSAYERGNYARLLQSWHG
jgi:dihydroorotate dehydrogenase (fumarate)